jgi:branched-chain amino acid aminotransferase
MPEGFNPAVLPSTPIANPETGVAFVDGQFIPAGDATISVFDFGFTRSDVTYDVVHVFDNKFFRLNHHLDRFEASMAALRYKIPYDREGIRAIVKECVRRTGLKDAWVGLVCTRGRPPKNSRDPRTCENRFIAYAVPPVWIADLEKQKTGLNVVIASTIRIPAESVDPRVKNYHWLDMVRGLYEGYDRGADTVVLLDFDGNMTEGPGFNAFAVRDGTVLTPDFGMLEGITRQTVIDLCAKLEVPCEVRKVSAKEFREADEVFITSTSGGVMPVTRFEGRILGNGAPGPVTSKLKETYWAWHNEAAETEPVNS